MKQKWPILIFSALLTAFIVLAGIWGNAQFEHLHSGSVLTAQQAVQGIALDGWRQEAPGQWHFTFTVGEDIPSLTLCVTNTAVPLAHESLTSLERSGELYALDVTPGETVELVFTCGRSPQTWLMTSAFASRAFRFRTMTQLIALTAFVTMGMVLLALYHYKHLPELEAWLRSYKPEELFNEDGTPTDRTKKILAATPMGHFGDSEKDLVGALLFLLNNDAAGFITGICLPVDGGFSAYSGV